MRVVVVGAGGYIGIPLCEELVRRGHMVDAVDRYFFGKYPKSNCGQIVADIRTMDRAVFDTIDAVIDLSGLSNDATAEIDPDLTRSINLNGAKRLATMAKEAGVRRYVYSSSSSVYGHGTKQNLTETDEVKPLTLYAECKAKVEDHIRSLDGDGFETVILRNATVFGVAPRMRFDLVANIMALTAWRDHQIMVRGGEQWRPLVHVDDVVRAFVKAVEWKPVGTVNVGRENVTMNQLARMVSEVAPWAKIVRVTEAVDQRDYHLSFIKFSLCMGPCAVKIQQGVSGVISALRNEEISATDPTAYTLQYYHSLIDWEKRLDGIRLDGKIL